MTTEQLLARASQWSGDNGIAEDFRRTLRKYEDGFFHEAMTKYEISIENSRRILVDGLGAENARLLDQNNQLRKENAELALALALATRPA